MMSSNASDLQLALAHYRMQFPVASEGLSATLITELTYEGGSHRGIQNFEQKILIRALLIRRAELDPDFEATAFQPPLLTPTRPMSIRVWI